MVPLETRLGNRVLGTQDDPPNFGVSMYIDLARSLLRIFRFYTMCSAALSSGQKKTTKRYFEDKDDMRKRCIFSQWLALSRFPRRVARQSPLPLTSDANSLASPAPRTAVPSGLSAGTPACVFVTVRVRGVSHCSLGLSLFWPRPERSG